MKRQIRFGVFESNSSSQHSISISNRNKRRFSSIPKDSTIVLNDGYPIGEEIFDEVGKLNYVVTLLASIIDYKFDYEDFNKKTFEEMIELDWFTWLAEVVKEESNTDVIYECPLNWKGVPTSYVPYYNTTFDDEEYIEDIFTDYKRDILENKDKFKERVRDIIYNPDIIIEDKEDEY